MVHIVINTCHGGFDLTDKAIQWLQNKGVNNPCRMPRHHPLLVKVVETMGKESYIQKGAYGREYTCKLKIVDVECTKYRIKKYDGKESVETPNTIKWVDINKNLDS
jgi:hypothetical protein